MVYTFIFDPNGLENSKNKAKISLNIKLNAQIFFVHVLVVSSHPCRMGNGTFQRVTQTREIMETNEFTWTRTGYIYMTMKRGSHIAHHDHHEYHNISSNNLSSVAIQSSSSSPPPSSSSSSSSLPDDVTNGACNVQRERKDHTLFSYNNRLIMSMGRNANITFQMMI
ncbi:hypothetical protein BLOT_010879 [Blomia tropicalis]|nr:hypothetical protein BLOT_010879 [Blomia tropicalis]